jgi:SAM-dependent methyltransferase
VNKSFSDAIGHHGMDPQPASLHRLIDQPTTMTLMVLRQQRGTLLRTASSLSILLFSSTSSTVAFFSGMGKSRVPGFVAPTLFSSIGKSRAELVLDNPQWPAKWPYSEKDFVRMDESQDDIFYDQPRLVTHIDDPCINALSKFYSETLRDGDHVLDVCSSWISHYPKTWQAGAKVVGLGMNQYELSQNPVLTEYVVKDLNVDPTFPFDDNSFDVVTCVVSIDYLTKPLQVVQEMGRVLKPGGTAIISMSNRCFPSKAFQIWLQTNDLEHIFIVGSFFHYSGLFEPPKSYDRSPSPGRSDPLYIVTAKKSKSKNERDDFQTG